MQGFRDAIGEVNATDTIDLVAVLRINEVPVTADEILSVNYIVQPPTADGDPTDGTQTTTPGTIADDGSAHLLWSDTTEIGIYLVQVQFSLGNGEKRSVMTNFTVIDPFNPPTPTAVEMVVENVWIRLEDIYDSIQGGPHLRDETLSHFDHLKIADFIPEALLDINVQMPPTNFDISYFTALGGDGSPNPNMPILYKGTLVAVERHLMRSYVEQPMIQGGQIVWEDRTRYQSAWAQQYQIDQKDFLDDLRLWKRTLYNFGQSSLLTFNKAGRMFPYGNMRARGAYRGYF